MKNRKNKTLQRQMMHEKVMENLFDVVFGLLLFTVIAYGWKVKLIQRQRQV